MTRQPLLEVKNLKKYFEVRGGLLGRVTQYVKAVDDVSFSVRKGETLGIVGESGCGKSTMGRLVLKLLEPTEGRIIFDNTDMTNLSGERMRKLRRRIQMIFQDPYASLNPRMTISEIVSEPLLVHGLIDPAQKEQKVAEILNMVELNESHARRYPHEFSGGQRQRICIARALSLSPELIVADEPVSALDVSVQSQVLNLMQDLQRTLHLTYIFISHDLSVVRHISDRVGVMYLGHLVEIADTETLFKRPQHPYTQALLSAVPVANPRVRRERIILQGDLPSPANPPGGCVFSTRCPKAMDICKTVRPRLKELEDRHQTACHLY